VVCAPQRDDLVAAALAAGLVIGVRELHRGLDRL
jgi:hypothetical protein